MLLVLMLPALATSYTETYGDSSTIDLSMMDDYYANDFVAEANVQLTGVSLYSSVTYGRCDVCVVTAYLWTRPSAGTTWSATELGTLSMPWDIETDYHSFTMTSTPTLVAGDEYLLGFYTTGNVVIEIGTAVTPAWAMNGDVHWLNYATGTSSRNWASPARYGVGGQVRSTRTFTAADSDRDGYDTLTDCDDATSGTHPGASDTWYDGVDTNCDDADDYDRDADGARASSGGGSDCDDTDADAFPGATDVWYDGVDSDCGGEDDYDQDGDGERGTRGGGLDCDDTDDGIHPGAVDAYYDGIDADCGGNDDYDMGSGVPPPRDALGRAAPSPRRLPGARAASPRRAQGRCPDLRAGLGRVSARAPRTGSRRIARRLLTRVPRRSSASTAGTSSGPGTNSTHRRPRGYT